VAVLNRAALKACAFITVGNFHPNVLILAVFEAQSGSIPCLWNQRFTALKESCIHFFQTGKKKSVWL
jgi:hypothetical protein